MDHIIDIFGLAMAEAVISFNVFTCNVIYTTIKQRKFISIHLKMARKVTVSKFS